MSCIVNENSFTEEVVVVEVNVVVGVVEVEAVEVEVEVVEVVDVEVVMGVVVVTVLEGANRGRTNIAPMAITMISPMISAIESVEVFALLNLI